MRHIAAQCCLVCPRPHDPVLRSSSSGNLKRLQATVQDDELVLEAAERALVKSNQCVWRTVACSS